MFRWELRDFVKGLFHKSRSVFFFGRSLWSSVFFVNVLLEKPAASRSSYWTREIWNWFILSNFVNPSRKLRYSYFASISIRLLSSNVRARLPALLRSIGGGIFGHNSPIEPAELDGSIEKVLRVTSLNFSQGLTLLPKEKIRYKLHLKATLFRSDRTLKKGWNVKRFDTSCQTQDDRWRQGASFLGKILRKNPHSSNA